MWKYVTVAGIWYLLYSACIDLWQAHKVESFQNISNSLCYSSVTSDDLLSTIHESSKIVEDVDDRRKWNSVFEERSDVYLTSGKYSFLHRSYADFEEKYAMCRRYYSLHSFLVYITKPSQLKVYEDRHVTLTDTFCFCSMIPVSIQCTGLIHNQFIIWKDAKIYFPWSTRKSEHLSKTIQQIPWQITHQIDDIYMFKTGYNKYIAYINQYE